jgi:NAD-dependent protein deacetylase/lipoamidase
MTEDVERARAIIADASRVVSLTGAGISAESGVPTFRGERGLWKSYRPEELATPEAFRRDPVTLWEWYVWRRGLIAACEPNAGHLALARLALRQPDESIITQNVDGLHSRAAAAAADGGDPAPAIPIEVHGAIDRDKCSGCSRRSPGVTEVDLTSRETLPHCEQCGAMLRPDVVWFGEALEPDVISRAFAVAGGADVCVVVGTSALVHPAASVPMATLENGGLLIEINMESTPLSHHSAVTLRGAAGDVLPQVLDAGGLD